MIPDYMYDFLAQGDYIGLPAQISVIPGSDYVLVQPSKHFMANKRTKYKFNLETQIWEPSRSHQPITRRRNNPDPLTVTGFTTEQTEQPGVIHSYEVPVNADPQAILGGCNPNLIFTQDVYGQNLEQFNQLDLNKTCFNQLQTQVVVRTCSDNSVEQPRGDKASGENVEHSSKDGQYQQYTSGNDDEDDFGPLDSLDRTYLRRTVSPQNSRPDANDFISPDCSTANTEIEGNHNISATCSTPFVTGHAMKEVNVYGYTTPKQDTITSNKEKCENSVDVFMESPKPGPSGLSNKFRAYPVEPIYQNSSDDD